MVTKIFSLPLIEPVSEVIAVCESQMRLLTEPPNWEIYPSGPDSLLRSKRAPPGERQDAQLGRRCRAKPRMPI